MRFKSRKNHTQAAKIKALKFTKLTLFGVLASPAVSEYGESNKNVALNRIANGNSQCWIPEHKISEHQPYSLTLSVSIM